MQPCESLAAILNPFLQIHLTRESEIRCESSCGYEMSCRCDIKWMGKSVCEGQRCGKKTVGETNNLMKCGIFFILLVRTSGISTELFTSTITTAAFIDI